MKKLLLPIIIFSVFVLLSVLNVTKSLASYSCTALNTSTRSYTCSKDGGSITLWHFSSTYDGLRTCASRSHTWDCSGSDSSCSGNIDVWGYPSASDCVHDTGYYEYAAGCCQGHACVAGSGCPSTHCTAAACSTGYTETNPNNLCTTKNKVVKSCSDGNDKCGNSCGGDSRNCYFIETNTSFVQANGSTNGPSSISMTVDGVSYPLSTDPNTPTHIKKPANGSTNVQVSVPSFTAPTTSDGAQYYFQADNYGVNDVWKGWTSCSGTAGEDFCITSSTSSTNFVPTTKTIPIVLADGAKGKISGIYQTKNICDTGVQSSTPTEGYYLVDSNPVTPINILPDIGITSTTKGCSSTQYTGTEENNPLHVVATVTDADGSDQIQAMVMWFSKDTTVPTTSSITSTYDGGLTTDLGVMIKKNGSTWDNPLVYSTTTSQNWSQVTDGNIKIGADNVINVKDIAVTQDSGVTFDFNLQFLPTTSNLNGIYNLYVGALDSYMINGGVLDQSYLTLAKAWGIDLVNPTLNSVTLASKDASSTYISWSAADNTGGSGISRVVLNGYRTGGTSDSTLELFAPTQYIYSKGIVQASTLPSDNEIGKIDDFNSWQFISTSDNQPSWLDKNWQFRKAITINNKGRVQYYTDVTGSGHQTITYQIETNQQILVTLDTATLIGEGKMRNDCNDIRFTSDDNNALSYWVEGGCNTSQTRVWVLIPTLPAHGENIYLYYGNSNATSAELKWGGQFIMLSDNTCPTGWTLNSDLVGRFPYVSQSAVTISKGTFFSTDYINTPYGNTGGSSTYNHGGALAINLGTVSGTVSIPYLSTGTAISAASSAHTHVYSYISSASSYPPYLTMLYCNSNSLDNISGLITGSRSTTTGWAHYSALDGKYALGGTTFGATGGNATHTHTFTETSSSAVLTAYTYKPGTTAKLISTTHTHNVTISASTASNIPVSYQIPFEQVTNENAVYSQFAGTTFIVTSLPPLGWSKGIEQIQSNTVGGYFSAGASTYGYSSIGSATHTHTLTITTPSSIATGDTTIYVGSSSSTKSVATTHTHKISTTPITTTADLNLPPYLTVTVARRNSSDQSTTVGVEQQQGETIKYVKVTDLTTVKSLIQIGETGGGDINMYATVYDNACNTNAKSKDITLSAWMTARGGSVYSNGSINDAVKNVSTVTALNNVFVNITKERLDIGTELIATRNTNISDLIHTSVTSTQTGTTVQGGVKATNIYDSNNLKSYWYNNLLSKLQTQLSNLTQINTITGKNVSTDCSGTYCYMNVSTDIHIPSSGTGYVCDKPTLFITSGDIYIEPNVTSSSTNLSGCIFVAKGNIYIGAGTYQSTSTQLKYDYLEGYLIADNQIIFSLVDQDKTIRDGIEILGGMTAFGSNISDGASAISIQRNLRFYNQTNPTVVLTYDTKFSELSEIFFGTEAPIYKQEVGFKNF